MANQDLLANGSAAKLEDIASQLPLNKLASLIKTILLVPAEWVTLTKSDIPSRQMRQVQKALPFALEEQLASDIDDLHFAIGSLKKDQAIPVAVVAREKIQQWIDDCEQAELYPDRILPDVLALEALPNRYALLLEGGRAVCRTGENSGLAVAEGQLPIMLDALLNEVRGNINEQATKDQQHSSDKSVHPKASDIGESSAEEESSAQVSFTLILGPRHEGVEIPTDVLEADLAGGEFGTAVQVLVQPINGSVTTLLARQLLSTEFERNSINLLQGEFKVEKKLGSSIKCRWQPVAATVAIFIVVHLGMMIGQTAYYDQEADLYQAQSVKLFKSWFPDVRRVKDIRAQLTEKITGVRSAQGDAFMTLIYDSGEQIHALNQGGSKKISLNRVVYDESQNNLRIDMLISSLGDLDQLKSKLEAKGLQVQIDQATQDNNQVKARLRIKS